MPTAVMPQPMRTAPASARAAMFCGSEKIPPPIMEPTTSAINAPSLSFCPDSDMRGPLSVLYSQLNVALLTKYKQYNAVYYE
ncbi:hypothetical protein D3C76_821380 [compost metagenome]